MRKRPTQHRLLVSIYIHTSHESIQMCVCVCVREKEIICTNDTHIHKMSSKISALGSTAKSRFSVSHHAELQ